MNRLAALATSAAMAAGASLQVTAPASSADLSGGYYVDSSICSEGWVLKRVSDNFRYQVQHVPNLPDVAIVDFRNVQLQRYLGSSETWPVPRTYCEATVTLSDGLSRTAWYFIEEGMGFAGVGSNVEACIDGFDRWNVYDGRCRVAR